MPSLRRALIVLVCTARGYPQQCNAGCPRGENSRGERAASKAVVIKMLSVSAPVVYRDQIDHSVLTDQVLSGGSA